MPLSENEQRLLEQMERALYAEDPKFASAMKGANRRPGTGARWAIGGTGMVGGLVVLVLGVSAGADSFSKGLIIGVVGFILMLAGTVYAVSGHRKGPVGVVGPTGAVRPTATAGTRRRKQRSRAAFMQRLEERWDRRRDQQ